MKKSLTTSFLAVLFAGLVLLVTTVTRADNIQVGYCTGAGCTVTSLVTVTGATPIAPLSSGTDAFTWSGGGFSLSGTVTSGAGGPLGGGLVGDTLSVGVTATDSNGAAGNVELIVRQSLTALPFIDTSLPGLEGYPLPNLPGDLYTPSPGSSFLSGTCSAAAVGDGSSVTGLFQILGGATPPAGFGWSSLAGSCGSGTFDTTGSGYAVFNVPPAVCFIGPPPPQQQCPEYQNLLEGIGITNGNATFSADATFNFAGNTTGTPEVIDLPIGGSLPTGTQPTPEPSTLLLMGCALAGLAGLRRRS